MDRFRSPALVIAAAGCAAGAWYGPGWIGLAPLAFVCWLYAPNRPTAFLTGAAYYAVAYACLPATLDGFFHGGWVGLGYAAVGVLAAALAGLWGILWSPKPSWWRPSTLLALLTLPPFGLAHVWSPLFGLAAWFPGFGIAAFAIFAIALTLVRRQAFAAGALVGVAALAAHAAQTPPGAPAGWVARDTRIATEGYAQAATSVADEMRQLATVENMIADAQEGAARVVVYPELHLGGVADPTLGFFSNQWGQLAAHGKTIIAGLGVVLDGTNANLIAGYGASPFQWRQRIPALGAMWRPWDRARHYPMRLTGAQVVPIDGRRTAIAICFEAGLLWPLLASQTEQPQAYIAVGNLSWGRATNLNRQGRAAVAAWSRLVGLPYIVAINN